MRRLLVALLLLCGGLASAAPLPARMPPRTRLLAADPGRAPAEVSVLVRGGDAAGLRAAGARPLLATGGVWAARVTPDRLGALARAPGVALVDAGHRLRPLLDVSGPVTGAPAARASYGLSGRGVVVGVVDTGIDTRHEDFRHPDGSTRILMLLDMSVPPAGLHPELEATYGGAVYAREDIDAWLLAADGAAGSLDTYGHGTHVAGIAAGNGRATGQDLAAGRYVGVAPEADLVVVKATRDSSNSFADGDIAVGVQFVFDCAARLGRPAVVNLSLGGQGGPHDGSTTLEQSLSALVAGDPAGRAIVVAAGNDGGSEMHAAGTLRYGRAARVALEIPAYTPQAGKDEYAYLELWYPAGSDVSVAVVSPAGRRVGPVGPGARIDQKGPDGQVTIDLAPRAGDGVHGDAAISIRKQADHAPPAGRWQIELGGTALRWDLWLADDTLGDGGSAALASHLDPDDHLAIPATAEPLIAVASFVSRNRWTNVDGDPIERTSVPGRASWFSAAGPTADGRLKPDLGAPGDFIVSALSADAPPTASDSAFHVPGEPHYLWGDDGVHAALRGTSQATPHVTGAAALLLEAAPDLSPSRLRELLRLTARQDELTGPGRAFGPRFGFGKLDVGTALRLLDGDAPGAVDPVESAVGVSHDLLPPASAGTVTVVVVPKDGRGLPLGPGRAVAITATSGAFAAPVVDVGTGRYERALGPGPRGAAATISATVDGVALAAQPKVFFVDAREEIGAPLAAAGGGCAAAAAAAPAVAPALAAALLALALLAPRRRRRR
ncbi:MAG TPA: S8 family serine peptidase [Polyangia bacterium]|jgi:subtilisin family serine protease